MFLVPQPLLVRNWESYKVIIISVGLGHDKTIHRWPFGAGHHFTSTPQLKYFYILGGVVVVVDVVVVANLISAVQQIRSFLK